MQRRKSQQMNRMHNIREENILLSLVFTSDASTGKNNRNDPSENEIRRKHNSSTSKIIRAFQTA